MPNYLISLKLSGRRIVVIGGGPVAHRKVQAVLAAEAKVTVVAPKTTDSLKELCMSEGKNVELIESEYNRDNLIGAVFVVAATNDNLLNRQIYKDCQELKILCNVVDVPELCDFFVPAVVRRQDLQVAISTDGRCPAYAAFLRRKLEGEFTDKHGEFLVELDGIRKRIITYISEASVRKALLEELVADESFEIFVQNGLAQWRAFADKLIKSRMS